MSEYGHFAKRIHLADTVALVDSWGARPFEIEIEGKRWRFEDSDRFGPVIVRKRDDNLSDRQQGERSLFWQAHLARSESELAGFVETGCEGF